ncbi:hypothetical protein VOLCADRAFT_86314 [Volvox carteri f. nagariensis]|uniref:Myb-like domain-containing protein n=1 Tax=Volvox carteri f. nagariensis TaxID=3068 RepID=D8TIF9_VOLCA|nr:uncharacterized protein VOLCADRAFT_86314 [Volvox carteri f. nagariensis]EFJ53234.1 hypothetical protein VOLCADRAFT_86314 [Volvox carteri f. nagariensis]|eukprot:XP_002946239.1 hypothetical protein VOLCADRAFT_86314 [Volvox carteri f. nagariensis]
MDADHELTGGLALPRLCLVSFAKRAICRQICPGMYPSFIRLSWPDTGEVLEDKDAGAPARAETQASCQRTLASYDVGHQSVLQLDIVVGRLHAVTALRICAIVEPYTSYELLAVPECRGLHEGNTFEAIDYRDLATVGTTTPTAAVAATEKRESPTGRGRQLVAQRALRVIGANAQQTRNAPRHQTAQARRAWTREEELQGNDPSCWRLKELQGNLCALVASQVVLFNGRCLEPGMQTVALLKGMKKYNGTAWKAILDDPEFAETLSRRTGVNLKDRWVNLEKAADRNFQNMKMKVAEDAELHDLVQQILAGLGKI